MLGSGCVQKSKKHFVFALEVSNYDCRVFLGDAPWRDTCAFNFLPGKIIYLLLSQSLVQEAY